MSDHHHDPPPVGERVRMHLNECEHGEAFVCVADVVLWLDRMRIDPVAFSEKAQFRDYIVSSLTEMALDYYLDEEGLS